MSNEVEITILRLMKQRDKHDKYLRAVPAAVMNAQTSAIVRDYTKFFEENKDTEVLTLELFRPFFHTRHPKLSDDSRIIYDTILKRVFETGLTPVEDGLMDKIIQLDGARKSMELIELFNNEGDVNLLQELKKVVEQMEADTTRKVKGCEVDTPIEDMLAEDENDVGLHWRLACLNASMRPLRGGDFGIIAGRPDKGKTSFLTSELTFMAQQIDALYPGEERCIMWFNNEGPGKRIKYRAYQSALNAAVPDMVQMGKQLHANYMKAIGGRASLLRVFDIHDFWSHEVEDVIKQYKPALIVFDMIDNIKFSGTAANAGSRTDQLLEEMYKWGRNLSVRLDVPVLATSQVSGDGDGDPYPSLGMLKDSKTGKQGAAEFIITLGCMNETSMQGSRFIGMTKNKLHRFGGPKDPRTEVSFDGLRGRYNMPSGELMELPT